MNLEEENNRQKPIFREAMWFWFELGWISFVEQPPCDHYARFFVEKKRWVSNRKFFQALNACMLLPGPEAHQLTIYLGWKLHGIKGAVLAGVFFIVPSLLIICGLSTLYAHYGNTALLIALFSGLKPAVLAIIIFATFRVGQKSLSVYGIIW
jgi:chromate transporter